MKKVIYHKAIALEDKGNGDWIFECKGKKYLNNLSIALDKDYNIEKGTEFEISSLSLEASDLVEVQ